MIIRTVKKINKIKNYNIDVDINYQYQLAVKLGDFVGMGENIALGDVGEYKEIDLNKEIENFNAKKDLKFLKVQEGEIVLESKVLFVRKKALGTLQEEVVSPMNGVVKLEDISKGIIRIVGEKKKKYITSNFIGVLTDRKTKSISLQIEAVRINCAGMYGNKTVEGEVVILNKPVDINVNEIKGKIAFVQFNLDIISFEKLIAVGAKGIISSSFTIENSNDINRINKIPFALIDGFGITNTTKIPPISYAVLDMELSSIIFQNPRYFSTQPADNFDEIKVGDYVRITRSDLNNFQGTVISLDKISAKIELEMKVLDIPNIYLNKVK